MVKRTSAPVQTAIGSDPIWFHVTRPAGGRAAAGSVLGVLVARPMERTMSSVATAVSPAKRKNAVSKPALSAVKPPSVPATTCPSA